MVQRGTLNLQMKIVVGKNISGVWAEGPAMMVREETTEIFFLL